MSASVYLLGLDPGFANLGWAVVELSTEGERLVDTGVLRTEKSDKKRIVLASDDNHRRARELAEKLDTLVHNYRVAAMCCESMSFPRNAAAAAKVAMVWGVIATLSYQEKFPVVQASPQEIKKVLCGKKDASKEEVEAVVRQRYKDMDAKLSSLAASYREHAYDSAGAIIAALERSEIVRAVRNLVS